MCVTNYGNPASLACSSPNLRESRDYLFIHSCILDHPLYGLRYCACCTRYSRFPWSSVGFVLFAFDFSSYIKYSVLVLTKSKLLVGVIALCSVIGFVFGFYAGIYSGILHAYVSYIGFSGLSLTTLSY